MVVPASGARDTVQLGVEADRRLNASWREDPGDQGHVFAS